MHADPPAPLLLRFGDARSHNWLKTLQPAPSLVQWWEAGLFAVVGHPQAARLGLLSEDNSIRGHDGNLGDSAAGGKQGSPQPRLVRLAVAGAGVWARLVINPGDEREGFFGSEAFRRFLCLPPGAEVPLEAAPRRPVCTGCSAPFRCGRLVMEPVAAAVAWDQAPDEHLLRRHLHGLCLPVTGASLGAEVILRRGDSPCQVRLRPYPSDRGRAQPDQRSAGLSPCHTCGRTPDPGESGADGAFCWLDGIGPLEGGPGSVGTDVVWWGGGQVSPAGPESLRAFQRTCDPAAGPVLEAVLRVRALGDPRWRRAAARRGVPVRASVLLRGARGSGKTWMVGALAHSLGLRVARIGFPELTELADAQAGLTARRPAAALELLWRRLLRLRPCVLFLDHIDLLFPAAARCDASRQELAATFRCLLRELETLGGAGLVPGLVVIGATQLSSGGGLWHRGVDADFQIHLDLGPPGLEQRRALLETAFAPPGGHAEPRGSHLSPEAACQVARLCQGWSPADLGELCRRAREFLGARRHRPCNSAPTGKPEPPPPVVQVLLACVPAVQAGLQTQAGSEVGTSVGLTGVRWEDVGGLAAAKRALHEAVVWPFLYGEALRRLRIPASSGVLLYGPPGTGKTLLAKAAAQESGASFIAVSPAQLLFGGVGQSERALARLFEEARANAPCVVFLDEIQALFGVRQGDIDASGAASSDVGQALVHTFVQLVDQLAFSGSPPVTVLAATNIPQAIDPILLRPGRLGRLVYCGLPNRAARAAIIRSHIQASPPVRLPESLPEPAAPPTGAAESDRDNLVRLLASRTKGFSGADVVQLMRAAALCEAIRDPGAEAVTHESYLQALALVRPSVSAETVRGLHRWGHRQRRQLRL